MPQVSQLAHRNVRNTNIAYKSNISPTDTDACYVSGSQDIFTSIAGYAERRPGFANNVEVTPTVFNNLQRLFTWDRFDGTFIEMACDINASGQSVAYKRIIGSDNSFVSLFTDTATGTPFDFVVSNNTCYFSNGSTAKKWDPINGLTNWGIAVGSGMVSGPNACGTGTDVSNVYTVAWSNPGNITAADAVYATATVTPGLGTHFLTASNFGFSIPSTQNVVGVLVEVKGFQTSATTQNISVQLSNNTGTAVAGTPKVGSLPTTNGFISFGNSSDTWGVVWTPSAVNAASFSCVIFANTSDPTTTVSVDFVRVTLYTNVAPVVTLTGTGLTASIGYQYVACYGNSNTGHISSPTAGSNVVKPTNQSMQVALVASTDAQVNQIRVFRSTDSVASGNSAGVYFEIPTSPFPNTTANIVDGATDGSLIVTSVAPVSGFNDPPTPFQSPVYFAGRIWGFKNNQVFYSGLEEILLGVPEESFVSGQGGNFWNFDEPVQALGTAGTGLNQTLVIFAGGRVYGITGSTLDTFQRFLISNRRGCRNVVCVSSMGGMLAWFDSAAQIWATNGNSLQEISLDIRPDLVNLVPSTCSLTFHTQGRFHWGVFSTGSKLFVYDMDLEQWMPPWSVAAKYVYSGETSPGVYSLMLSTGTKAIALSTTAHNDNGATYTPIANTNLFPVVPDFGKRFSYAAQGLYDEPSRTGYPNIIQVDTNNVGLGDVLICSDDDPLNSSTVYTSIFNNQQSPSVAYNRGQGANLVQNVYPLVQPEARWIGIRIKGQNADDALKMYSFFLAYKSVGGR
jgi:hypothetical protein